MDGKICVAVPVYNTAKYLTQCIDSLLAQTYKDYHIVIIDDGSTDGSADICRGYAGRCGRVSVFRRDNSGQAAARNAAIDIALENGFRYIAFIDSDDFTDRHYLEALHEGVCAGARVSAVFFRETDGSLGIPEITRWKTGVVSAEDFYCHSGVLPFVAWGKLFDLSLFQKLRFPPVRRHEDTLLIYRLLFESGKIAVTPAQMYAYRQNPEGTTAAPWTRERLLELRAMDEQLEYFKKHGYEKAHSRCAETQARMIAYQISQIGERFPDEKKLLEEKLEQYIKKYKLEGKVSWPR